MISTKDGGTLASLTNLTQQDLNDLHSYAYTAYQSGDVITARNLFHSAHISGTLEL